MIALLEAGRRVATLDLADGNLVPLASRFNRRLVVMLCDVSNRAGVRAAVEEVVAQWGRVDILVNNAAVAVFGPIVDRDIDDIRREFDVNYFGYLNLIDAVLPSMRRRRGGIIHNVSSAVGLTGFAGLAGYTSTKGAIEALTRTLAIELAPESIAVTLVHPPLTRTRSAAPLGIPDRAMAESGSGARSRRTQLMALGAWGIARAPLTRHVGGHH